MIKIENTDVNGFDAAIRGMRNPLNSWSMSDSETDTFGCVNIGENDAALMMKLVKAGSDHRKFMRMITVTTDITAPLYWWKEFDTYKVGTVRNSCSTMHTIHKKPFELDDFSRDHLCDTATDVLESVIKEMNFWRWQYTDGIEKGNKYFWWQIIQLLPSSYNQRATVQVNYAVLRNMYHSRRNHKLDEWRTFCEWLHSLPVSELITEGGGDHGTASAG